MVVPIISKICFIYGLLLHWKFKGGMGDYTMFILNNDKKHYSEIKFYILYTTFVKLQVKPLLDSNLQGYYFNCFTWNLIWIRQERQVIFILKGTNTVYH